MTVFAEEQEVALAGLPEFYTQIGHRDLDRIETGQADPTQLDAAERYALQTNWRLVPLDYSMQKFDDVDPDLAHDGYTWCSLDPENLHRYASSGFSWADQYLLRVKPKRANGIYVVDEDAYDKIRAENGDAINRANADLREDKQRHHFTRDEIAQHYRARAATLVPWNEYDGSYVKPVVLIGRELGLDEVEFVKKIERR